MKQRKEEDLLLRHEYDGIREYDNPTPGWWHAIFLASIVFSLFYYAFWEHSPMAPSIHQQWETRQVRAYQRLFGEIGDLEPDARTLVSLGSDTRMMAVAQGMFIANCAACHAKDGGGGGGVPGVNLTDDAFKNVARVEDLFTVITAGAANGAMPAWENRLGRNERVLLAAYVAALRGTPPAGAKGPEGEVIPPWPEAGKDGPS